MSTVKIENAAGRTPDPKPTNVFYVWYGELCRRAGTQPLSYVKPAKPKNGNVLDFVADRIKPEEWGPVLSALRRDTSLHVIAVRSRAKCTFLDDIDTKEKFKAMKRRAGSLHTTYMCRALMKTLTTCVVQSQVLSSLELEALPIGITDIEVLVAALQENQVIKVLTLKNCNVGNLGCQLLCSALRQMPNIEVLDLTGCKLDAASAHCIAKVVKTQQINRYCESWHNSLRYEDVDIAVMAGLRRITLNNNPCIGNEGLTFILDELDDDLWIKALDMQRCGVSEDMSRRLLDVVEYSRSLEIADFRHNHLDPATIERIFDLLKEKRTFSSVSEFKWCYTTTTLSSTALPETQSRCSVFYPAGKSKSVPVKNIPVSVSGTQLRRTKTTTLLPGSSGGTTTPNLLSRHTPSVVESTIRPDLQRSVTSLHSKLQRETSKRIRIEQENRKLKEELERVKATIISVESNVAIPKERTIKVNALPHKKSSTQVKAKPMLADHSIKPAINLEFVFENRQVPSKAAFNLLQNLVGSESTPTGVDENSEVAADDSDSDIAEVLEMKEEDDDDSACGSQASLIKFMCEIKRSE